MKKAIVVISLLLVVGCSESSRIYTQEQTKQSPTITASQTRNISRYVQRDKWYSGGTLHRAKMKEWSQASYNNKLATASDFTMGLLKVDGIDLMTVDIENEIKPMATDLVEGLDAANRDGIADSLDAAEVAATIWVIMKSGY